MKTVAVVDYGMGNLRSVSQAVQHVARGSGFTAVVFILGMVAAGYSSADGTLTALTTEIAHLRTGLEALADRVRQQEERLRRLETSSRRKTS